MRFNLRCSFIELIMKPYQSLIILFINVHINEKLKWNFSIKCQPGFAEMMNYPLLTSCLLNWWSVSVWGTSCRARSWSWSATPSSFLEPGIKVTWNTSLASCTKRGNTQRWELITPDRGEDQEDLCQKYFSFNWHQIFSVHLWYEFGDQPRLASPPAGVGQLVLPLVDRCQVVRVRFGARTLATTTNTVWLPSIITSVSTLSTLAVFSTSPDCSLEDFRLTICPRDRSEECRVIQPSSFTETYIRSGHLRLMSI